MPIGTVIAGVAAATAVVGTTASVVQGANAAKQQRRSAAFERQKADLQAAQQRRDTMRAGMAAYADAQASAENQGVADSSGAMGGQGSIQSQVNSNLSFLDSYSYLSDRSGAALGKANEFATSASIWGGVAKLGEEAYSASGGFKGPKPPAPTTGG